MVYYTNMNDSEADEIAPGGRQIGTYI